MIAYVLMPDCLLLFLQALAYNAAENYSVEYPSLKDPFRGAEQVIKEWQIYAPKYLISMNYFPLVLKNLSFSLAVGTHEESSLTPTYNFQES